MKMIHEFQMSIVVVVDHSILEMVPSSKATSLSGLPVRNEALGDFLGSSAPVVVLRTMVKIEYNFQCSLSVGGHCLCRVAVCTLGHNAVSSGSLHHKHNDKLPSQGMSVWSFLMVTCIHQTM